MKAKSELPRKRKAGLVVQELADEVLVYDSNSHRAHCLNWTASAVWKHCDGKTTPADMAGLMTIELDAPVAEELVWLGLDQLRKARLLETPISLSPSPITAMSRREAMRRVGLAAAAALPVVTSIIAPKAAHAASCRPNGDTCNGNGNCCSHNCVGGICV